MCWTTEACSDAIRLPSGKSYSDSARTADGSCNRARLQETRPHTCYFGIAALCRHLNAALIGGNTRSTRGSIPWNGPRHNLTHAKSAEYKHKLLSLRDRIEIFDDAGTVIYSCSRAPFFSSRSFFVNAGETEVARIKRKLFSWAPTWLVEGKAGNFAIRTRLFSLRRVYDVKGGPFHGAQVRGNLWDVKFMIALDETLVAQANKRLISLRDTHAIEVMLDDDASELLSVVAMIVVLLHNRLRRRAADEERRDRLGRAYDDY